MENLDLFELQIIPYFKLNSIIWREIKRPKINFYNVKLFFDVMKIDVNIQDLNSPGISALHYSAIYNNIELTKFLLERGADVNIQDNDGVCTLHYACHLLCEEMIKLLLSYGANVNLLKSNLENPLMLYVQSGKNKSIIDLLIKSGVNLNQKNIFGDNVIDIAKLHKNEEVIPILLNYL